MNRNSLALACVVVFSLLTVVPQLGRSQAALGRRRGEHTRLVLEVPLPLSNFLGFGAPSGAGTEGGARRRKQPPAELDFNPLGCQLDKEVRHRLSRCRPRLVASPALPLLIHSVQFSLPHH